MVHGPVVVGRIERTAKHYLEQGVDSCYLGGIDSDLPGFEGGIDPEEDTDLVEGIDLVA